MLSRRCMIFVLLITSLTLAACAEIGRNIGPLPASSPEPRIRIAGTRKALPAIQKLAEIYRGSYPGATFEFVSDIESIPAIREVGAGTLDLALSSRPLSSVEPAMSVVARPFARDAVVFATNPSAALPGLSSAQIRAIYGGQVTTWEQLGGASGPIILLDREASDSAHEQVLLKLLDNTPIRARTVVYYNSNELLDALETTPGTLGYSQLGLLRLRQPGAIRVLALDGVTPSPERVSDGTYPWSMTFFLVHHVNTSPAVRRFLDFAGGRDGRRVLEEYGYGAATR